jgi:hypothetical protein
MDTAPYDRTPGLDQYFKEGPKSDRDNLDMRRWWLGKMAEPGFNLRDAMGIQTNADGSRQRAVTNEANARAVADTINRFFESIRQAAQSAVEQTQAPLRDRAIEAGDRRQNFERETGPRWGVDRQENALQSITGQVSLIGTPTVITQPSGVQQVTMTNPPQPNVYNVSATVTVNEAADGAAVARQFASTLKSAIAGTHANFSHQAHA